MSKRTLKHLLGLVVATLAVAPAAWAQDRDTSKTASDSAPVLLEPISVTTSRSGASRFELPLAITYIGPQQLAGVNGYGLDGGLSFVPGVIAQSRYGTSDVRITIRGFGARGAGDRSNAGTSRGIRVLLDGFPETEPDGRTSFDDIDLAAASQIEVVRSNASAEWGNAAGGVVNVSTTRAFNRYLLELEPAVGSYGLRRYTARVGSRVGAGRVSASVVHTGFDGWRTHSAAERTLANLSLTGTLAPRTDLGIYVVGSSNQFHIPGPLTMAQVGADPRQANATYLARDERRENTVVRIGTSLKHQATDWLEASGMVFANPKVLHRSERGTYRDFTRFHVGGNAMLKARGRLSPSVTGVFFAGTDAAYQDGAILFYSLSPEGTRGTTLQTNKREGARNLGVFTQAELGIGDRFTLAAGARFDDITYRNEDFVTPRLNAEKSFRGVSPKFGITYRLSPTHNVYGAVGGGVEAPAGNETDPVSTFGQDTITALNPLLDPIRTVTYELGSKHVVQLSSGGALRGLSYDLALFHTNVTNEIVPYRGGRFYFTAGRVRRRGAEFGGSLAGPAATSLRTALAFSNFQYTSYTVDSVHYGRPGASATYAGNRVVGVPNMSYTLGLSAGPTTRVPLFVRLTLQGMSAYFADDANAVTVPAFRTVAATVGLAEPVWLGRSVGLSGFVTVENLLDRAYVASAFLNPDLVGGLPVAFEPGMPRHLIAGFTLTGRDR